MSNRILAALILANVALSMAGAAQAQVGLSGGYDVAGIEKADRIAENTEIDIRAIYKTGADALTAKDYSLAARSFGEVLHRDPANADVNFLMGLSEIGLVNWSAAKGYLETATKLDPKRPEPKTRLGLTYVALSEFASADKTRDDLASLDAACKKSCSDAKWIADGLRLLDDALAAAKTNAASTPVATPLSFSVDAAFRPADFGFATFKSAADLYPLLTQDNRCPPGYKPERSEPCALIAYKPETEGPGVYKQYYRPIFGVVNKNTIWTIVDSRMVAVSTKTLWAPVKVDNTATKGVKDTYFALAVVGNRENAEKCNQAKACLPHKELFLHYRDFKALPQSFVDEFWGKQKLTDPGQKRFSTGG